MHSVKKSLLLAGLALVTCTTVKAQYVQPMRYDDYSLTTKINIGAGTVRATAPSAYLEIGPSSGANKGMLAPRLTTTERDAISSPADGLWIYNKTTKKFQYYDGGSSIWRDIGSGAGGSGITQLGNSTWGLIKLNDSTYLVDSMKVLTKYQGEKTMDSLAILINLRLAKSDTSAMLAPLWTAIGKKVDTTNVVQIDTSDRSNGKIVYWDATARKYKHKTDSVGTGGGGSGAFSVLKWRTGDEFAPAAGDSLIKNTGFSGKYGEFHRGSNYGYFLESVVGDTGFTRVDDTTFKVKPPFADNEWYYIKLTDSSSLTQLTLQDNGAPPSTTIAYVGGTDGGNNGGATSSRTFSFTVSAGSDRILLVGFVGDLVSGADDVSSVTYNGVAMTLANKTDNTSRYQYLYYMLNPPTGAHNVVITYPSTRWILAGASEYTGVQGIDVQTTNKYSGGTASTLTTSLTTTVDNCWTVLFMGSGSSTSSAGAGATKRVYDSANYWSWYDSGSAITPAGSHSMTTTTATGSLIGHCMIALKPY